MRHMNQHRLIVKFESYILRVSVTYTLWFKYLVIIKYPKVGGICSIATFLRNIYIVTIREKLEEWNFLTYSDKFVIIQLQSAASWY